MAQAEVLPLDEKIVQIQNDKGNSDNIPALVCLLIFVNNKKIPKFFV